MDCGYSLRGGAGCLLAATRRAANACAVRASQHQPFTDPHYFTLRDSHTLSNAHPARQSSGLEHLPGPALYTRDAHPAALWTVGIARRNARAGPGRVGSARPLQWAQ
jgi:hypothetical protein